MARTHEYYVALKILDDGVERVVGEASLGSTSMSKSKREVIALSTQTANYQVNFGSNFTTPTKMFLKEHAGYSFTYSVGASTHHHLVAASGAAFLHGSIASLYFSNNSTTAGEEPEIELILVR
jgi:hypothetical protein